MTTDRRDEAGGQAELGGPGGEDELRARLDAYAASHLEPDPAVVARTRMVVMAAMAEAHRGRLATGMSDEATGTGLLGRLFRQPALAAATALAGLSVLMAGTVAAASPGGPLYETRVWVETLTLPSDATARAVAELDRLQSRLDDAKAAAANGNGGAVTAALDAYRQTLADAFAAVGSDPMREASLAAELGRHLTVLEALASRVPSNAATAIGQAVQRTASRIDELMGAPGRSDGMAKPGNPNPGGPNHTPTPGQPDGTAKPGNPNPGGPNHTPTPRQPNGTAKPSATPDPSGTPPSN